MLFARTAQPRSVLADGTNTYLYGNARLAQYQASMQYFGADGLGSVRQIYDASGQVVGSSRYDPFGNLIAQSGTATSVLAFAGEQQDATGLAYLRARYYSAAQGRFTTRDVWEGDYEAPLTLNRWNYTNGNPVMYADPSGKCPLCVLAALGLLAFFNSGCSTPPVNTPVPPVSPVVITQVVVVTNTPAPATPAPTGTLPPGIPTARPGYRWIRVEDGNGAAMQFRVSHYYTPLEREMPVPTPVPGGAQQPGLVARGTGIPEARFSREFLQEVMTQGSGRLTDARYIQYNYRSGTPEPPESATFRITSCPVTAHGPCARALATAAASPDALRRIPYGSVVYIESSRLQVTILDTGGGLGRQNPYQIDVYTGEGNRGNTFDYDRTASNVWLQERVQ